MRALAERTLSKSGAGLLLHFCGEWRSARDGFFLLVANRSSGAILSPASVF
jgi:hypothetical protein